MDSHLDFLKANFDKILLFLWLACLVCALIHFAHKGESGPYDWAVRAYDNIQGALLMLLTGRAIQQRKSDNSNGGNTNATGQQSSV